MFGCQRRSRDNPDKPEASPTVVGEMTRYVIESGDARLRFPVGPDPIPFMGWRATLSDEGIILGPRLLPCGREFITTGDSADVRELVEIRDGGRRSDL
jgi:hypothetical protein